MLMITIPPPGGQQSHSKCLSYAWQHSLSPHQSYLEGRARGLTPGVALIPLPQHGHAWMVSLLGWPHIACPNSEEKHHSSKMASQWMTWDCVLVSLPHTAILLWINNSTAKPTTVSTAPTTPPCSTPFCSGPNTSDGCHLVFWRVPTFQSVFFLL